MKVIHIQTLNDNPRHFNSLFALWRECNQDGAEIRLDFRNCRFLRQNAVAFLGGLTRLAEHRGGRLAFDWDSLQDAVSANLAQNGFMAAFDGPRRPWSGNSIPFREDPWSDPHDFQSYLADQWLGRGWVNVSTGLRDAIVGRMAEAYLNAFEHAQSPAGVFTCGQHFPKNRELNLTIVDFGVGIPSNVRLFQAGQFQAEALSAAKCMEWAFQSGTSTKPGMGRGLGLDLLQAFVRKNRGRMEMFSHEGYAAVTENGIAFADRASFFEGTLVNISLRCDESYYCLASEAASDPLF